MSAGQLDRPAQIGSASGPADCRRPRSRGIHRPDDERDADGEQHLRQMIFADAADEEAIDQVAERDDRKPAAKHAKLEAAGAAGNRIADIAAKKIIGAVRHVHDAHQPEAERESAREQEQQRGEARCR